MKIFPPVFPLDEYVAEDVSKISFFAKILMSFPKISLSAIIFPLFKK